MKLALAQINTTIGDFEGNAGKILNAYRRGEEAGVDVVICPELALCGYPPRDLLLKAHFLHRSLEALNALATQTGSTSLVVGYVGRSRKRANRPATNGVALLRHGKIAATREKSLLPTYDVFDEERYFEPAHQNLAVPLDETRLGLTVCEDLWNDEAFWREPRYDRNPPDELMHQNIDLLINVSASPWHLHKQHFRHDMLVSLARHIHTPVAYCNLVGGNDELIFDGSSMVVNAKGEILACGKAFAEDFLLVDLEGDVPMQMPELPVEESLHRALVLGIRDYMDKCGFRTAVLGLSGGIDSALTACLAVEALGKENVRGVSMPSHYSSQGSLEDSRQLADHLGIRYDVISIRSAFDALRKELEPAFAGRQEDTTEENIQARLRGTILMALSNKFGSLLLTTGNKSELAVGYTTLYGDMCGGLSVISDVPKLMVYRLARWINRNREIIPSSTLTKPPSAELRPNQTDQDSLPPYDVLDAIIEDYVVQLKSASEIIAAGYDEATVHRIIRLIDSNEYKRRQAAPGLKVTSRAFGVGRRIPVAQKFRE